MEAILAFCGKQFHPGEANPREQIVPLSHRLPVGCEQFSSSNLLCPTQFPAQDNLLFEEGTMLARLSALGDIFAFKPNHGIGI